MASPSALPPASRVAQNAIAPSGRSGAVLRPRSAGVKQRLLLRLNQTLSELGSRPSRTRASLLREGLRTWLLYGEPRGPSGLRGTDGRELRRRQDAYAGSNSNVA
jgi:hypothetical protein